MLAEGQQRPCQQAAYPSDIACGVHIKPPESVAEYNMLQCSCLKVGGS